MQLTEALEALADIGECASSVGMDAEMRMAWIGQRAAETLAAAKGDYEGAQRHKTQCNAMAALMRMYARTAALQPVVIGGVEEDADVENAMGRSVWYRRFPRKGDL